MAVAVAALLFAVDVVTKNWAEADLRRRGARSHLGGHLVLRHQTNTGIAFGLFQPHLHPHKRLWLIGYGVAGQRGPGRGAGLAGAASRSADRRWPSPAWPPCWRGAAGNLH